MSNGFINIISVNKHILSCFTIFTLIITLAFYTIAQEGNNKDEVPLFTSNDVINLTIRGDLKALLRDSGDERDEHPLQLLYEENGDTIRLDVNIITRGNFRRKPENCSFPPLRLNFKKKQVKNTLFHNINKIKLVTHCKSKSKKYKEYVLEEYMVYRTFNTLTDTGYRVRLAHISYVDTVAGKRSEDSYAFFIEPDKVLARRLNAEEVKSRYVLQDRTQIHHMSNLAVYEYMIGNTDWAVTTLHNIKLFSTDSTYPPFAIPYDFDWCGLVDTEYARPLPRFGTENVTTRIFRGYCRSLERFKLTFLEFEAKKDEFYGNYENFELMDKRGKKRVFKYFDEFFDVIGNDKSIKKEFMDACLKEKNY